MKNAFIKEIITKQGTVCYLLTMYGKDVNGNKTKIESFIEERLARAMVNNGVRFYSHTHEYEREVDRKENK